MIYGYRVVNIFRNGTHVHSRVNLVHFKGVQLDPYETYMMKLTWCTWDCLLEHGAHSRHITQIGIHFILRNTWHINVPWNISKIFYWISFFSSQRMILILNYIIFCIVYYANCTYCELVYLIGTYIVQGFDMKLLKKMFSTALTFIWDPASASMKLRMYQVRFFFLPIRDFDMKFWNLHYFHLLERCIYLFFFQRTA